MKYAPIKERLDEVRCYFSAEDIEQGFLQAEKHGYATISDYRDSPQWQVKRQEMLKALPPECYVCLNPAILCHRLHHKRYANLCEETTDDLAWLCDKCHAKAHYGLRQIAEWNNAVCSLELRGKYYERLERLAEECGYGKGKIPFLNSLLDYAEQNPVIFRKR